MLKVILLVFIFITLSTHADLHNEYSTWNIVNEELTNMNNEISLEIFADRTVFMRLQKTKAKGFVTKVDDYYIISFPKYNFSFKLKKDGDFIIKGHKLSNNDKVVFIRASIPLGVK
jgi:hypothetical protein